MRPELLDFLLSATGRAALAELDDDQLAPAAHLATAERLRARWGAETAGALLETAQLRQRARAKFARAAQMFFTRDGLEQATAEPVAEHRARRFAAAGLEFTSSYAFWDNFEQRPARWVADWDERDGEHPAYFNWLRFAPAASFDDPWLEAARLLLLVDLGAWPAVTARHNQQEFIAPSIDVSCEFHSLDVPEWLLLHGESDHASDGLIGSRQAVWSDDGRLLATGISHLLCRAVR